MLHDMTIAGLCVNQRFGEVFEPPVRETIAGRRGIMHRPNKSGKISSLVFSTPSQQEIQAIRKHFPEVAHSGGHAGFSSEN